MMILRGSSVSPGVARGKAFIYTAEIHRETTALPHHSVQADTDQHARIRTAMSDVQHGLETDANHISRVLDATSGDIFRAQSAMLQDGSVVSKLDQHLNHGSIDAEEAVREVFSVLAIRFRKSPHVALRTRGDDIEDLSRRLLLSLRGIHAHRLEGLPSGTILVARHLYPSDTVFLSRHSTIAVIAEFAGPAAHAALLARELGIPCVGGIERIMESIQNGDDLIVDGALGLVFVHPDLETSERYELAIIEREFTRSCTKIVKRKESLTTDSVKIAVMANARSSEDVHYALRRGADGIGLFRTEPFFMACKHLPSADEFTAFLSHSLEPVGSLRVNIRLLDIGADKNPVYLPLPVESDPFLGLRGVRVLLRYPDLLDFQARALLETSRHFNIGILIPMVTLESDVVQILEIFQKHARSMKIKMPPIGAMIETPAAALSVDSLKKHVDFFSIGSNDLTQYTMAAGRENPSVHTYFLDDHPAILRLIGMVIAEAGSIPVSLCGELAGRISAIPELLRVGLRSLSVATSLIADVRQTISKTRISALTPNDDTMPILSTY